MISAVVLVNTDLDAQDRVIESLRLVDGIEEAHALNGVYDPIVKIKGNSIDKLKEITKLRIKPIAGVNSLLTLMIVQDKKIFVVASFCDNIILYYFQAVIS